jgi:UDP-glucose:glycoprotein glucosyltransferase
MNIFEGLPTEPIYTLAMETLTSWLVRPNDSVHDLDNIHLASLSPAERAKGVEASFRLDYLVIEGHSRDSATTAPTAGLQLQLTDHRGVSVADTMVVANLGYLQLKAPHPGSFGLEIRDERGKEIYYMESAGNAGFFSPNVTDTGNQISLTSLEGLVLYPRFHKNPGMEREDVLTPSIELPKSGNNGSPLAGVYKKYFHPQLFTQLIEFEF